MVTALSRPPRGTCERVKLYRYRGDKMDSLPTKTVDLRRVASDIAVW